MAAEDPMDIRRLRQTALDALRHLDWAPPLLARLVIGAVFVPTGWGKLHNLPDIVDFFRQLGIPYPEIQAPFVSSIELVCGALVLVGLATRLAAIPLIGTMVVAIVTAIWPQLDSWRELFGKEELHYIALLAYLVVTGPGAVALDALAVRFVAPEPASAASAMRPARA
jgi:putative oxidoreductase